MNKKISDKDNKVKGILFPPEKVEAVHNSLTEIEHKIIDSTNLNMDCEINISWEKATVVHK